MMLLKHAVTFLLSDVSTAPRHSWRQWTWTILTVMQRQWLASILLLKQWLALILFFIYVYVYEGGEEQSLVKV